MIFPHGGQRAGLSAEVFSRGPMCFTQFCVIRSPPIEYHSIKQQRRIGGRMIGAGSEAATKDSYLPGRGLQSVVIDMSSQTPNHVHPRNLFSRAFPAMDPNQLDLAIAQEIYQRICPSCSRDGPTRRTGMIAAAPCVKRSADTARLA